MTKRRSLFSVVRFCAAPALAVALGCAILFISAALGFAIAGGEPVAAGTRVTRGERTFTCLVTDDHCGARHEMDSGMNPSECTRMCVRNGSKCILIQGDKRYVLAGSENKLDEVAGQRANIAGTLAGNTIKVGSVMSMQ